MLQIPAGVNGFFNDIKYLRSQHGPEVDSASNRNEYQGYFLGVKAAGKVFWFIVGDRGSTVVKVRCYKS